MSGIVALVQHEPVDPARLRELNDRMAHRGPDGSAVWCTGDVGLAQQSMWTTSEAAHTSLPLADESGACHLVFDGRVDNRRELRTTLVGQGARLRDDSDAELVLKAYIRWNEQCASRIIGDFAFCIWDANARQLYCARDPIGIKPLYYHHSRKLFVCASELQVVARTLNRSLHPNEGMVAEYLALDIRSREETLYQEIQRLPPGHYLTIKAGQARCVRHWHPNLNHSIRYRSDDDYAEHFAHLFRDAVSCRLRSNGPVGLHLSGGLDSSSVVSAASDLNCCEIESFSLVFPGLPCDESRYINAVTRKSGVKPNLVPVDPTRWSPWCVDEVRRCGDFPGYPNGVMANPLRQLAVGRGFRVMLTGFGGDDWLDGATTADRALELLQRRRWLEATREAGPSALAAAARLQLRLLLQRALPSSAYRGLRDLVRPSPFPPWIARGPLAKQHRWRLLGKPENSPARGLTRQAVHLNGTNSWQTHALEIEERASAHLGLEERAPFEDTRLIEFVLAIPESQRWRMGLTKFVLRRAMRTLLPVEVAKRTTKAEYSALYRPALQAEGAGAVFAALKIASAGWVDQETIEDCWNSASNAENSRLHILLWMSYGMDCWLRNGFV